MADGTTVSIKEHFDDKFVAVEKRLDVMESKIDILVDRVADHRVELVKSGVLATMLIALAEIVQHQMRRQ